MLNNFFFDDRGTLLFLGGTYAPNLCVLLLLPTIYTEPMETVETDLPRRLTLAVY